MAPRSTMHGGVGRCIGIAALAWALATAGCGVENGEGAGEPNSVTVSTTATTMPTSATVAPATTTTFSSTTTTRGPTTTTRAGTTTSSVTTLPPSDASSLPGSLPPDRIPWDDIGTGWLLVRYRAAVADPSGPEAPEVLFLIGPDNTTYAVATAVASQTAILDWSPDGHRILTLDHRGLHLEIVDLRDGTRNEIPVESAGSDPFVFDTARFTRPTGRDVVVRLLDWGDRARLECLHTDGTRFADLGEYDIAGEYPDAAYLSVGVNWLYAPDGMALVVASSDGIRMIDNQGDALRDLDTPGMSCALRRWWGNGSVLAACFDREWAASPCWDRGPTPGGRSLWSVPVDGSEATRLTPTPVCRDGASEGGDTYADGLALGDVVAAVTDHCCECGGALDFVGPEGVIGWLGVPVSSPSGPEESSSCSPMPIAVRGDRLLVADRVYGWDPDHGATGHFGVIVEVSSDGTVLDAITPMEPGKYGGVVQVLTTEESTA